jgi:dimethylamine corrinoid protein
MFTIWASTSRRRTLEKVQETDADLLGLSALLTMTTTAQQDVLEALQEAGIRDCMKVMVGGAGDGRMG